MTSGEFTVSEIFTSVQGEGRFMGRPSTFLRLGRCNLHCVWCDSAYTWRFSDKLEHEYDKVYSEDEELKPMAVRDVFKQLVVCAPSHVVITGGEPLLQPEPIKELLRLFMRDHRPWTVEFETAGTLSPILSPWFPTFYTVSPKLANSGNNFNLRRRWEKLAELVEEDSVFKFVVCDTLDLEEVDEIVRHLRLSPNRVYIMPEGTNSEALKRGLQLLVEPAMARGYQLTTRLQIEIFGNKRGT